MHRETAGQLCSTATRVPLTGKGAVENDRGMNQESKPKGTDLGQYSQEQINLMMSHISPTAGESSVIKK